MWGHLRIAILFLRAEVLRQKMELSDERVDEARIPLQIKRYNDNFINAGLEMGYNLWNI